ncbi:MAG TPA: metallophosphoesterase [Gammaproteobacteria bacterium]|jgi:hypothetical protein|nr:metallophosphoesterase [Gammaproteobacteria bacterium]
MHFIARILVIYCTLLALPCFAKDISKEETNATPTNFLVLSDIHFDPFLACQDVTPCPTIQKLQEAPVSAWPALLTKDTTVAYGKDTSYTLLTSSLSAASQAAKDKRIAFVVVLGDFLAHDYREKYVYFAHDKTAAGYRRFVRKTLSFLDSEMQKYFQKISIYGALGNNDSYVRDYGIDAKGAFFKDVSELWSVLIQDPAARLQMKQTFSKRGYYSVLLKNPESLRVVFLNSSFFSSKAKGKFVPEGAKEQLVWLRSELEAAKAKNEHVLICMHIPMGIDVYSSLHGVSFSLVEFWMPAYAKSFKALLETYAAEIVGVLAGHLHADWFQALRFRGVEIPVIGTPAISPVYHNNPGFKIYTYSNQSKKLEDFETYYYPIKENKNWMVEYIFSWIYGTDCKNCSIGDTIAQLRATGRLSEFYQKSYMVSTGSEQLQAYWYPYYWCAIFKESSEDYQKCVGKR